MKINKLSFISSSWFGFMISIFIGSLFYFIFPFERGYLVMIGLGLTSWLAYENGGNDVSRGVAPLVACDCVSQKKGLTFGTIVTLAGSLFSIYFSMKVLNLFTSGILNADFSITNTMVFAIIFGASMWIAIATKYELPVSTTHSLVGAMVMVGLLAFGLPGVIWSSLGSKVIIPLLFSPLLGFMITWGLTFGIKRLQFIKGFENASTWVFCAGICFVRALNDTPKIVGIAVLIGISSLHGITLSQLFPFFLMISLAMALGSYLKGAFVLKTLAYKITPMNITTSLSTALSSVSLILLASKLGLPVSTTHVSTSSVLGSGFAQNKKEINWKIVKDIGLSWVVTLPGAGLLGLIGYYLLSLFM